MRSLVLLRPDKAGDLIKTLPVLRALCQGLSEPQVHLIVSKANESLLRHEPDVTFSVLPSSWDSLSDSELKIEIEKLLQNRSFDTAINLLCDSFPKVERLLQLLPAQNKFSVFSPSLPSDILPLTFKRETPARNNESANIAELIGQALGIELSDRWKKSSRAPKLSADDFTEAEQRLGQKNGLRLALCPLAGTEQRTHSLVNWARLAEKICKNPLFDQVFIFGAPADSKVLEDLRNKANNPDKLKIVLPSSFRTLGAHLKTCDRVVAVDSGPLHFSLALGIPSLGFLSGGDYKRWFSQSSSQDKLVPRGILNRYPSYLEMAWHFSNWIKTPLKSAGPE